MGTPAQTNKGALLHCFAQLEQLCSKYDRWHLAPEFRTQLQKIHQQTIQSKSDFGDLFLVVMLGAYSAGKSSLINTLAGQELCETGVQPTTDSVRRVPIAWGNHKWTMVDTPGLDAMRKENHKKAAIQSAQRANLAVFVINARQPLRESELPIIQELLQSKAEVLVAINYWNHVEKEKERTEIKKYVGDTLAKLMPGSLPKTFRINAIDKDDAGILELREYLQKNLSESSSLMTGQKEVSARGALKRDGQGLVSMFRQLTHTLDAQHEQESSRLQLQASKASMDCERWRNELDRTGRAFTEMQRQKDEQEKKEIATVAGATLKGALAGLAAVAAGPVGLIVAAPILGALGGLASGVASTLNQNSVKPSLDQAKAAVEEASGKFKAARDAHGAAQREVDKESQDHKKRTQDIAGDIVKVEDLLKGMPGLAQRCKL